MTFLFNKYFFDTSCNKIIRAKIQYPGYVKSGQEKDIIPKEYRVCLQRNCIISCYVKKSKAY